MRVLILGCCVLLLPALALAQFPGFGQPDGKTPTFNGSSVDLKTTSSRAPNLQTGPGIATPRGQGGPVISLPSRVPTPRRPNRTRTRTDTNTQGGGNQCPRQSSFAGPLVR